MVDLILGEDADEADWRALVERGLKGASWSRLEDETADGVAIAPLYREPDVHTATDVSGFPGTAPFIRGAREGDWDVRQSFAHPNPARLNQDILADLAGGVTGIELAAKSIASARDLDQALADVILEAAPVSLDGPSLQQAEWLETKLKGVAAAGTAFNLDLLGAPEPRHVAHFTARVRETLPAATALRADARPAHEAGASEAQEIAIALAAGIAALRALDDSGLTPAGANGTLSFAIAAGSDAMIEAAKLRALRLCWARVMEASGAAPEARAARIHAFTGHRMLTRYDAWTNILRITTAAFGAGVGGADAITTANFTDALGLPTPFARRVARNTQIVLLEECRLGHVADPSGGAWFVEHMTRALAEKAWSLMQEVESLGGLAAALKLGFVQGKIAEARARRERLIATRRETITGVTDYPLLDARIPDFEPPTDTPNAPAQGLTPIRWAAPFEALRDCAEAVSPRPAVFFATLGPLADFGPRAQFARNLFAAGGVNSVGEEAAFTSRDAMIDAFRASQQRVAVICGADDAYAREGENTAQRLKAAGADWVILAGKPGDTEGALRTAGVDQFVFPGTNALKELETVHAALRLKA